MNRILALAMTAPLLTACGLDKIADKDKPNDFQLNMERRAALIIFDDTAPPAPAPAPVIAPMHAVVPESTDIWPIEVGSGPDCQPVFRLVYCP